MKPINWVAIGTLASIAATVGTGIQAYVVWQQYQREEAKQLLQSSPSNTITISPFISSNPHTPSPSISASPIPSTTYSPSEISLESDVGADYNKLRSLLMAEKYKEADQETLQLMLWLSHRETEGWLDDKSIENLPCKDLHTIDSLWLQQSNGRFGFSVQKQIYNEVGKNYAKFTEQVGWFRDGKEFITYDKILFEIRAPKGHLPGVAQRYQFSHMGTFPLSFLFGITPYIPLSSIASRFTKCNL